VRGGRIDVRYRIDVQDADDRVVYSLSFADAVQLVAED
jgi:hypothetical protein